MESRLREGHARDAYSDLRRTGITRALLGGMVPAAVQKLAGHKNIATTMKYYVQVERADLRAAVKRLRRSAG